MTAVENEVSPNFTSKGPLSLLATTPVAYVHVQQNVSAIHFSRNFLPGSSYELGLRLRAIAAVSSIMSPIMSPIHGPIQVRFLSVQTGARRLSGWRLGFSPRPVGFRAAASGSAACVVVELFLGWRLGSRAINGSGGGAGSAGRRSGL